MKYEELTINKCLELMNKSLFLPDIQRPYVWDESDIYLLYDSVCREYPINTVLFWLITKETLVEQSWIKRLRFIDEGYEKKYRTSFEKDNQIDTSSINRDSYLLAIDGQQRLTSFYLTLYGNYKIKTKKTFSDADLYYNLDSGINENVNGILFEFKFFPQMKGDVFSEEIHNKTEKTTIIKNWIRMKFIYAIDQRQKVLDSVKKRILDLINLNIDNDINNRILEIWFKLKQDEIISYYREETQDYDKVLEIFVRTNSGGQKLKYSDLLFSYIKRNWGEARDKFSLLINQLNENGKYNFDHDFILKTILFIHATEQEHLKYSTKNFTPNIIEETKNNWDSKLVPAIKIMKDLISGSLQLTHHKLVTSNNALIPIIYFIYKFEKRAIGEESNTLTTDILPNMREWLLTCMLTSVFGGQSDSILFKAKKGLDDSATFEYFPKDELYRRFNEIKTALTLKITEAIISKASYNSIDSHLILSLLYKNTMDLEPCFDDNKRQQDHIFSQKELKDAGISKENINSIYNIRWVSASDNRVKSDESYQFWSERMKKKNNDILNRHFIPDGNWTVSNFDDFINARKKIFSDNILPKS